MLVELSVNWKILDGSELETCGRRRRDSTTKKVRGMMLPGKKTVQNFSLKWGDEREKHESYTHVNGG